MVIEIGVGIGMKKPSMFPPHGHLYSRWSSNSSLGNLSRPHEGANNLREPMKDLSIIHERFNSPNDDLRVHMEDLDNTHGRPTSTMKDLWKTSVDDQ